MQITRATDYAVRVMVQLATLPEGQKVQLRALAEGTNVRQNFLSKILQRLVHQGLVSSHRGTGGGFSLKSAPQRVTLLQVIEAMEGPTQLNVCLGDGPSCDRRTWCGVHPVWRKAQGALTEVLASVSIAQLAEETAANQKHSCELQAQADKAPSEK
jgi:Rrf2 family transcriptional regulator, iron-sulfur cluster assembly transcription factor